MKGKHFMTQWWGNLPVPRESSFVMLLIYFGFISQGVFTLNEYGEYRYLGDGLPQMTVALIFVVGGIIGAASIPKGYWMFEQVALILLGGMYVVHEFWVLSDRDGGDLYSPGIAVRIGIIFLFLVKRYFQIRHAMLDPMKN